MDMKKSMPWILALVIVLVATVVLLTVFVFNQPIKPELLITKTQIEIKAPYGVVKNISDIVSMDVQTNQPFMEKKVEGVDINNSLSGTFVMKGLGEGYVYLGAIDTAPYIYIKLKEGYILLNGADMEETAKMYDRLIKVKPQLTQP